MTLTRDPASQRRARGRRTAQEPLPAPDETPQPFTLPHFREWARGLILDTGDPWTLEPFVEWFAADVFAGYSEIWLVVPEGNTKTTTLAGLGLYHCEFRPFAVVPVAAASRDQAQTLYAQGEGFVLRSARMHEQVHSPIQEAKGKRKLEVPRFNPLPGYRRIDHHQGGKIQIYAADDATGDGVIPTLALLDELHRHRDLRLYRTWAGKLLKRQGQIIAISTAGEPGSDFELTRERIRQSATDVKRHGSFTRYATNRMVLHEWAVPEGADVEDMDVVKAANPFSGITTDTLEEKFHSPTMTLSHWRRFVCNVPTRADNAAITEADWEAAAAPEPIPEGERIWLGLDIAWKWDTTAAVPFWMPRPDWRQFGPAEILVPPRDGTNLHPDRVKGALRGIHDRNPIDTVVMDMSRGEDLAAWIRDELGAEIIDRGTSNVFAAQDYERFMEALASGVLKHSGDPGLTQHALNAVVRTTPSGDGRFDRPAEARIASDQDRRVIDGLSAASMVHGVAVGMPEPEPIPEPAFIFGRSR